jgi:hypothetical protein
MIELEENLIPLLESIEDCLAKRRLLPCLILLYSAIDIVSSLEPGRASGPAFMAWADNYLLQGASLPCTASDLYAARCGILHTLSAESNMSRKGTARHIMYAWGGAKTDELERASKELGRNDCVVHVHELINTFRVGLVNYLQEVMQDKNRKQKLHAGAGMWFTHMDQNTVKAFLDTLKPN